MSSIPTPLKIIGGIVIFFGIVFVYYALGMAGSGQQESQFETDIVSDELDINADRERYGAMSKSKLRESVAFKEQQEQIKKDKLESLDTQSVALEFNPNESNTSGMSIGSNGDKKATVNERIAATKNIQTIQPSSTPTRQGSSQNKAKVVKQNVNKEEQQEQQDPYFYTITKESHVPGSNGGSDGTSGNSVINIKALIFGDYNLGPGDKVRIRLLEPLNLNGEIIPANTIVNGLAQSGNNQRLNIIIRRVDYRYKPYVVDLHVFDSDGMEGLYVPINDVNSQVGQTGTAIISGAAEGLLGSTYGLDEALDGANNVSRAKSVRVFVRDGFSISVRN